jgi:carboxylate-amine ligase
MHLFQGYGIELEYMIVDLDTLKVKPVADELIKFAAGSDEYVEDFVNGSVTWSNELILHVIELKCTTPTKDLWQLNKDLHENVQKINGILKERFNACLLPTAAHPWMNPKKEAFLWPHGNSEVYEKYNEIFDCSGHGWSNLQSVHINLPFYDNQEFAALHSAARCILPLLPALAASSPILDAAHQGIHDQRLIYYQNNQKRIPSITGKIIPEAVTSRKQYREVIYDRIAADIKPFDPEGILQPLWLNSRGIIARFDRGSIEIRIIDLQECPKADLAIAALVIHAVKFLMTKSTKGLHDQLAWKTSDLHGLLMETVEKSSDAVIKDAFYLELFDLKGKSMPAREVWSGILDHCLKAFPDEMNPWESTLREILKNGSLSKRILSATDQQFSQENLRLIYKELSDNLSENELFLP